MPEKGNSNLQLKKRERETKEIITLVIFSPVSESAVHSPDC